MRKALYPGTFDPITFGHLDILNRALNLFDEILITIAINPIKIPFFTLEERKEIIKQVLLNHKEHSRIIVKEFNGLLVNFAREQGASAIIRGLRAVSDFEYELQMALMNRRLADKITTVFMMPHEKYTYLNSTIVKEVASLGGDISNFVPKVVEKAIMEKLRKKDK
jgi:pantetheine-phosphate adenylyltransferase